MSIQPMHCLKTQPKPLTPSNTSSYSKFSRDVAFQTPQFKLLRNYTQTAESNSNTITKTTPLNTLQECNRVAICPQYSSSFVMQAFMDTIKNDAPHPNFITSPNTKTETSNLSMDDQLSNHHFNKSFYVDDSVFLYKNKEELERWQNPSQIISKNLA